MPAPTDPLPPDVSEALARGATIEAIKRLRDATGLGLAEAKAMIEFHQRGRPQTGTAAGSPLEAPGVADALSAGNKIEAIKRLREHAGLGLKEAKDAIEAAMGAKPRPDARGLAPGEMPRSNSSGWWLLAVVGAALLAYFVFFGGTAR